MRRSVMFAPETVPTSDEGKRAIINRRWDALRAEGISIAVTFGAGKLVEIPEGYTFHDIADGSLGMRGPDGGLIRVRPK